MRLLAILTLSALAACGASALTLDDYVRVPGESAESYVERVKPDGFELAYGIFETDVWDKKAKSIVAFFAKPATEDAAGEVQGYVYMKQYDVDYYRDISIGPFDSERDPVEILDVFFADVDKDPEKEMAIIQRQFVMHYDFTGYICDVRFFDNPDIYYDSLAEIDKFGQSFVSFEGSSQEGMSYEPEYTTKASVLAKLKKLGR